MGLSEPLEDALFLALKPFGLRVFLADLDDLKFDFFVLLGAHLGPFLGRNFVHFLFDLQLLSLDQHAFFLQLLEFFGVLLLASLRQLEAFFFDGRGILDLEHA